MTTVTGLTAERMLAIEGASVIDGDVVGDNLVLTRHNGQTINAGNVRGPAGTPGAPGAQGPPGLGAIPGEVRMWPGAALPAQGSFGLWVWADGGVYPSASYPIASGNIAPAWRTFGGASDPGAGNFRVPDMRGLTPVGMDAMPNGARANRMTRAVAIVIAGRSGEEIHTLTIAEMPTHFHGGGNHAHSIAETGHESYEADPPNHALGGGISSTPWNNNPSNRITVNPSGQIIQHEGWGGAHENLQPSVFMPYIVCLHG